MTPITQKIISIINTLPIDHVIVFDIDSTLLDLDGRVIEPIAHTYHYARQRGHPIAIITARQGYDYVISYTIDQLHDSGIRDYDRLYFMSPTTDDQFRYKMEARKSIHDDGEIVGMSIGDMPQDIGEYGGVGVIV